MYLEIFLCLALFGLAQAAQPPTPVIGSVFQTGFDSHKVVWSVDDPENKTQLARYRIRLGKDAETFEWPAQITRVQYDSTEPAYQEFQSESNFECFNECLKDPECVLAVRSANQSGVNCYLKNSLASQSSSGLDADSEYALVGDYDNLATIEKLSSNAVYSVQVSVYDIVSAEWSNFSDPFTYDTTIKLEMDFARTGANSGLLTWVNKKQYVSKFNLIVSVNQSAPTKIPNINSKTTKTLPVRSNYFLIEDYANFTIEDSNSTCESKCIDEPTCVQMVYFTQDYLDFNESLIAPRNSCYLLSRVDLPRSIYKATGVVISGIENPSLQYELDGVAYGVWAFSLETVTPYGIVSSQSATTRYNLTDLTPTIVGAAVSTSMTISWNSPEAVDFKRYALMYRLNGSQVPEYFRESSTDFNDPQQITLNASTVDECFQSCFGNTSCLAYTFDEGKGVCELKTTLTSPLACSPGKVCSKIPDFKNSASLDPIVNTKYCFSVYLLTSFGYITPESKPLCLLVLAAVQTEQVDTFYPGLTARIRCLPYQSNGQISWYKDFVPLDLDALDAELSANKEYVTFNNITGRVHNGLYFCENVLNNTQVIASNNIVRVKVNETAPSRPERPHIVPQGAEGVVITWTSDPFTSPVSCAMLYWSLTEDTFENGTECSGTLKSGVMFLNTTFDCKTKFKVEVQNEIGWSEPSEMFQLDPKYCKGETKKPRSYLAGFIVVLCFLVISVCVAGFFIYRKYRSSFRSEYVITD